MRIRPSLWPVVTALALLLTACGGGGGGSGSPTGPTTLPPLSEDARRLVIENNQNPFGAITRWTSFPIAVWADPGFRRVDVQAATGFWEREMAGTGVAFQITDNRAAASIVFDFGPLPPGATCGVERPTQISMNVIGGGEGTFSAAPQCTGAGNTATTALAHGLGHILGFAGHTPSNTDIMSAPEVPLQMTPSLREAMRFIYSVPPGTRI